MPRVWRSEESSWGCYAQLRPRARREAWRRRLYKLGRQRNRGHCDLTSLQKPERQPERHASGLIQQFGAKCLSIRIACTRATIRKMQLRCSGPCQSWCQYPLRQVGAHVNPRGIAVSRSDPKQNTYEMPGAVRLLPSSIFLGLQSAQRISCTFLKRSRALSALNVILAPPNNDQRRLMTPALLAQSFSSNPLSRSVPERKQPRFLPDLLEVPSNVETLLTVGRSVCVQQQSTDDSAPKSSLKWFQLGDLSDFGIVKHGGVFSVGGGAPCTA